MLLVGRHEDHLAGSAWMVLPRVVDHTLAAQDEYLMLPGVHVERGVPARRDLEVPEHEMLRAHIFGNEPADLDALRSLLDFLGLDVLPVELIHDDAPEWGRCGA